MQHSDTEPNGSGTKGKLAAAGLSDSAQRKSGVKAGGKGKQQKREGEQQRAAKRLIAYRRFPPCNFWNTVWAHVESQDKLYQEHLNKHTGTFWPPHQEMQPYAVELRLEHQKAQAQLALQARRDLGDSSLDAWPRDPTLNKLLSLPVLDGAPVTYGSSGMQPYPEVCGVIGGGRIRCQGKGCKFVGSCCDFARHLKHNVKDPSRSVWLCDYQISLKDLAQLVMSVDLYTPSCVYCCSADRPMVGEAAAAADSKTAASAGAAAAMHPSPAAAAAGTGPPCRSVDTKASAALLAALAAVGMPPKATSAAARPSLQAAAAAPPPAAAAAEAAANAEEEAHLTVVKQSQGPHRRITRGREAAGSSTGADKAAAAAAAGKKAGSSRKPKLGQDGGGFITLEALLACSTCPAAFHASCYKVATGEEVGGGDSWQCISCRSGAACAAEGCEWCVNHSPHDTRTAVTMEQHWQETLQEWQAAAAAPPEAAGDQGFGSGRKRGGAAAADGGAGGHRGSKKQHTDMAAAATASAASADVAVTAKGCCEEKSCDEQCEELQAQLPPPSCQQQQQQEEEDACQQQQQQQEEEDAGEEEEDNEASFNSGATAQHPVVITEQPESPFQVQPAQQQQQQSVPLPSLLLQQQAQQGQLPDAQLPDWTDVPTAGVSLLAVLRIVGASFERKQQLRRGMQWLQQLPADHIDLSRFKANYCWVQECLESRGEEGAADAFREGLEELIAAAQPA